MSGNGILRIDEATVCGDFTLELKFSEGTRKRVNVKSLLTGPVFQPLRSEDYFNRMVLDKASGTVSWPNGADFAPEALFELPAVP